jgi:hypothetical protein
MTPSLSDRRAICALRCVDAPTGQPLSQHFEVSAPGARFRRNAIGLYVLLEAPGFESYTREWEQPPAQPAVGAISLAADIRDPARRYLTRRVSLRLPRDPSPANSASPDSLFQPIQVRMFPTAALTTLPNWASIFVTVRNRDTGAPIPNALLRVLEPPANTRVLGRGMTGPLGEALVAVANIRLVGSGEGEDVLVTDVPVTLEAIVDPNLNATPDPDDLENRRSQLLSNTAGLSLAAGRRQAAALVVPRPPEP